MRSRKFPGSAAIAAALVVLLAALPASAKPTTPFDEETLDQIAVLNRNITEHYNDLQETTEDLASRREIANETLAQLSRELETIDAERTQVRRSDVGDPDEALRLIEEHRIATKSRYLEALAEKHAIDLEATKSFEKHGTAILINLERLATALDESGQLGDNGRASTREGLHSLQRGTAIALSVLEDWGQLSRDDPRFRALWGTARVLNRNLAAARASEGIRATVDLVRERTFVVRSLVDQSRALRVALDHQGLLLQVAAQNQMLRLHFNRLGAINGMELPDLDIEDSTRRILEDIEEEPFTTSANGEYDPLAGFDDCVEYGSCQ